MNLKTSVLSLIIIVFLSQASFAQVDTLSIYVNVETCKYCNLINKNLIDTYVQKDIHVRIETNALNSAEFNYKSGITLKGVDMTFNTLPPSYSFQLKRQLFTVEFETISLLPQLVNLNFYTQNVYFDHSVRAIVNGTNENYYSSTGKVFSVDSNVANELGEIFDMEPTFQSSLDSLYRYFNLMQHQAIFESLSMNWYSVENVSSDLNSLFVRLNVPKADANGNIRMQPIYFLISKTTPSIVYSVNTFTYKDDLYAPNIWAGFSIDKEKLLCSLNKYPSGSNPPSTYYNSNNFVFGELRLKDQKLWLERIDTTFQYQTDAINPKGGYAYASSVLFDEFTGLKYLYFNSPTKSTFYKSLNEQLDFSPGFYPKCVYNNKVISCNEGDSSLQISIIDTKSLVEAESISFQFNLNQPKIISIINRTTNEIGIRLYVNTEEGLKISDYIALNISTY